MKFIPPLTAAALLLAAPLSAQETLHTAVDPNFAPHASMTLSGELEGFQLDLGDALAEQLGVTIDVAGVNFVGIIPGMNAGTYDFILAPVTANAERAENMLFTEGYIYTGLEFGHKSGTPDLTSLDDLAGKTVAVNKGSNYDQWAQENAEKYGFSALTLDSFTSATDAVVTGRADYQLGGTSTIKYAALKVPSFEPGFVMTDTRSHWSLAVAKDNVEMRDRLETAIECLKLSGKIADISEKWFGVAPGADDAENIVFAGFGVPGLANYDDTDHTPDC
ncbi:Glutamine-binding periplasmic protein precursor [Aquimixticola soesokkakensis]|uniref:Glutamine-binding periplasmic protein n=1 Tax=Aquimixticola soesokkakensis TaxID=1519096 RepID=A0A1Y5RY10_9RHOB|nr:transporter substrate-binding domain-containing protein [Aquimixticola soesokkakensis]SLN27608.1 Glutamine-binding periplasmic protein precursor [Aquimixticola soesokkakensis]